MAWQKATLATCRLPRSGKTRHQNRRKSAQSADKKSLHGSGGNCRAAARPATKIGVSLRNLRMNWRSADKKSTGWMRDRHPAGTSEGTVTA
jgi:hypothetical protein